MQCEPLKSADVPHYIFVMAESFSAALNMLSHATIPLAMVREHIDVKKLLTIPEIVNESFSVELYFKCLHACGNKGLAPRGHDLLHLFTGLPPQQQMMVEKKFKEVQSKNTVTATRANKLKQSSLPTIMETLRESNRAFEKFRYAWEDDNRVRSFDLMNVRIGVRETILQLRPEFKQVVKGMAMIATAIVPCGPNCRGVFGHFYKPT